MAGAPKYKVFNADGVYQAACKEPEAAAVLVTFYGEGSTIRWDHAFVIWTEGLDGNAGDSYDIAAESMNERLQARHVRAYAKSYPGAKP